MSVPSVNIYASKVILKSRLVAALAFERSFHAFLLEGRSHKVQSLTTANLLAGSRDTMETYDFLRGTRQREFDNAPVANTKAGDPFNTAQKQLELLSDRFEQGIQEWKKDQVMAGIKTLFSAVVKVGLSLATLFAKLKEVYGALKGLFEKVLPVTKALKEVVAVIQNVIAEVKQLSSLGGGATAMSKSQFKSTDVFNATAEWRRFDIIVRDLETSMVEYAIPGKPQYFQALKLIVVNGETNILTQANLVSKGDMLATVLLQQKMGSRDEARLAAVVTHIADDSAILNVVTRAMFDRVLAVRHLVYLDFFTYTEAYKYHTLSQDDIVALSPVKPMADYLNDMTKLQGAIASFSSKSTVKKRAFQPKTLASFADAETLGLALSRGETLSIQASPNEQLWRGFGRIRLSSIRCWLTGVQTKTTNSKLPVRLEHESVLGEARKVLFKYRPDGGVIGCDGSYGQKRDYTMYTPMTK
ncbi:hypothetical protein B0T22DRAFT_484284 [Podospora appendiculata]|uniref:Uncharacterized protein n=1 Tax=Podospora appendiculata TaxID=314037 RepID=A0AAE1C7Y6_9PEZI|nr:hypothetical protein B0T22DRAFT_484284 [Podospora appendiculata]